MRHVTNVLHEIVTQSVIGGTESSGSDPIARTGFLQILQEASASLRMCSADSERLRGRIGDDSERKLLLVIAAEIVEVSLPVTAEKRDILLKLDH